MHSTCNSWIRALLLAETDGTSSENSNAHQNWNVPNARVVVISIMLAVSGFASPTSAGILYWDTDGSTAGNNASTGANLGGSGIWSSADAKWWDTSFGVPQAWSDGSDAVFWGS